LEFAMAGFIGSATSYLHSGAAPGLLGSHSPTFAPYGAFRCSDDHLVIAASGAEHLWGTLCEVLGRDHLVDDTRFATNAARVAHRDELTDEMETALATAPAAVWAQRLTRAGVPVGSVRTLGEVLASPQLGAQELIRSTQAGTTHYQTLAPPLQIDGPLPYPRPAPDLGQHTREVLQSLGLSEAQIQQLHQAGQVLAA
jgi:crotonobetainyl-CoA:carnitine CoA-transferase CaiB-like acyl-CoA transferase